MSDTNNNNRHPDSIAHAEYPYNQSTVTRSGHEFHVNDTPGHESIREAHTTGTMREINKDGDQINVVVGKLITILKMVRPKRLMVIMI